MPEAWEAVLYWLLYFTRDKSLHYFLAKTQKREKMQDVNAINYPGLCIAPCIYPSRILGEGRGGVKGLGGSGDFSGHLPKYPPRRKNHPNHRKSLAIMGYLM
jgi:hypothetical protein